MMFDENNDFFGENGFNFELEDDAGMDFNPFEEKEKVPREPAPRQEQAEEINIIPKPEQLELPAESVKEPEPAEAPRPETKKMEEKTNEAMDIEQKSGKDNSSSAAAAAEPTDFENLFEKAVAQAEEKQAEDEKSGLIEKLPIFSYANAKEEITDPSKTFDRLREEKAEDFPELDDGSNVTWKMEYGKIIKNIPNPKKTTIAEMKAKIEKSKEFFDSLKKVKGEVQCKVIPSVAAKKKGVASGYKGVVFSLEDARRSGKAITFIPSNDGNVYEIRCNGTGTFVVKADKVSILPKVKAGFIPALPKIPYALLDEIIAFFRSFVKEESALEAAAEIYWSFTDRKYYTYIPKQSVSRKSVEFSKPEIDSKKFQHVLEIHSHNKMRAFFSEIDDRDERATGLYMVIGRLDRFIPDIRLRMSVGGKFKNIDISDIFELPMTGYPQEWLSAVNKEEMYFVKERGYEMQ